MTLSSVFRRSLLLALAVGVPASATGQTAAPPNATVYIINLKDGDTVASPFKVQFGLTGMGVAPAGVDGQLRRATARTGRPPRPGSGPPVCGNRSMLTFRARS